MPGCRARPWVLRTAAPAVVAHLGSAGWHSPCATTLCAVCCFASAPRCAHSAGTAGAGRHGSPEHTHVEHLHLITVCPPPAPPLPPTPLAVCKGCGPAGMWCSLQLACFTPCGGGCLRAPPSFALGVYGHGKEIENHVFFDCGAALRLCSSPDIERGCPMHPYIFARTAPRGNGLPGLVGRAGGGPAG